MWEREVKDHSASFVLSICKHGAASRGNGEGSKKRCIRRSRIVDLKDWGMRLVLGVDSSLRVAPGAWEN